MGVKEATLNVMNIAAMLNHCLTSDHLEFVKTKIPKNLRFTPMTAIRLCVDHLSSGNSTYHVPVNSQLNSLMLAKKYDKTVNK